MKRKSQFRLVLVAVAAIAVAAWLLVPGPFGHGVIVGFFVGLSSIVTAMLLLGKVMRRRLNRKLEPPPLPTISWDYQMEVVDLEGEPVSLAAFAGKVFVLNFWATWCGPCAAEMPSLRRLIDATTDLDVQFGFVTKEDPHRVRQFVEKQGMDLPVYLLSGEPPECFKTRGIPATFVLDRAGMIALRHIGAARWDAESVVAFVRGLAAKPPI